MPPIVGVFQAPGLTEQQYKESVRQVTGGKSKLESPADWPVEGLLVHVAGQGKDGFRVVDVWDSEESFQRFGEVIGPILKELGIDLHPEVYPAKVFVSA
jgi:hypothetical protein